MSATAITTEFVQHLNDTIADENTQFSIQSARRFDKIISENYGQKSVHAFIERETGNLIKAASYKAPQKDKNGLAVRYNLSTAEGMAEAKARADKHGSYLYAR